MTWIHSKYGYEKDKNDERKRKNKSYHGLPIIKMILAVGWIGANGAN